MPNTGPYYLDPLTHIVAAAWAKKVDVAVCYGTFEPVDTFAYTAFATVTRPFYGDVESTVVVDSVGRMRGIEFSNFRGSEKRSFPENGNGFVPIGNPPDDLPDLVLPSPEEFAQVYLWHCGHAVELGWGPTILWNLRKLAEDHPDETQFSMEMTGATEQSWGTGGQDVLLVNHFEAYRNKIKGQQDEDYKSFTFEGRPISEGGVTPRVLYGGELAFTIERGILPLITGGTAVGWARAMTYQKYDRRRSIQVGGGPIQTT